MIYTLWLYLLTLFLDTDPPDGDAPDPDEDEDEDEPTRDPEARIKALTEKVARLGKKLDKKDARIAELESQEGDGTPDTDTTNALRLEVAFLRSVLTAEEPIADLDTAWTLGHGRGFFDTVDIDTETGDVTGMDEALAKLLGRYPYLADEPPEDEEQPDPPAKPSGRPMNAKTPSNQSTAPTKAMRERFPALTKRIRVPR
jgi:hypothetical protein